MEKTLEIQIKNFRNITNQIKFNLVSGKLNFFVGDNNIGKTNILRAINLLNLQTTKNSSKFIAATDKPSTSYSDSNAGDDTWEVKLNYKLPDNYLKNKFISLISADDFKVLENKFITKYEYISYGNINENGEKGMSSPLFSDDTYEKRYEKNIKNIDDELINETYPNFYNLIDSIDDINEPLDNIIFTYQDIVGQKNDAFFRFIKFLDAFSDNPDQKSKLLEKFTFIKKPKPTNLSHEDSQKYENKINRTKIEICNDINKNLKGIFSPFKNLHCNLQISLGQDSNILLNIHKENEADNTVNAITIDLQGSSVKKVIKLIYLLQYCKSQKNEQHVLLIDEIENCLSINTQLALLEYLRSFVKEYNNVFIAIVTHSPTFFSIPKNQKYDDYLMLNVCCPLNDHSLGLETIAANDVLSSDTGYEFPNGEDIQNGVIFLSKVLDMPVDEAKKIKMKNNS